MPSVASSIANSRRLSRVPHPQSLGRMRRFTVGLRGKTLAITAVILIMLMGILYVTSHTIMLDSFAGLEKQETEEDVQRVLNTLSSETDALVATTRDWSIWDDTYHFAQNDAPDYVSMNLGDSVFNTLKLNLMVFTDASGKIIYAKSFDLAANEEVPLPDSLLPHFASGRLLGSASALDTPVAGILMLPESPVLVVSEPILTSSGAGPAAGRLLFGRYLDNDKIQEISQANLLDTKIYPVASTSLPDDIQLAEQNLSANLSIYAQPLNEQTTAGYGLMNDIYGKPALILRVDIPRDTVQQGQVSISYLLLAQGIAGILCAIAILWLLEQVLLSRLVHLSNGLTGVRESASASLRVPVEGHDELADLAYTINETLASLEQSQANLHTNQELIQTVVTSAPLILFAIDVQGIVTLLEGKRLSDLGINPSEIIGHSILDSTSPIAPLLLNAQTANRLDTSELTATLGNFSFDIRYTPLRDEAGVIQSIAGVATDITERKRMEQGRLEAERLRLELEKGRDVLALQERFISTLSHEFRTPLAVVLAAKESLQYYYDRMQPERRQEHFQNIDEQTRRMIALLDDLLTISKTNNGKKQFAPARLDLVAYSRKLFDEMRMTDQAQRRFVFDCNLTRLEMSADERLLHHILANLLSNAIKYSPSRGEVRFALAQEEDEVVIRIQDHGIGIPSKDQPHLFEPFYRATNAGKIQGTGLGLAIVKECVEVHGGRIAFESVSSEGTTFTVRLPLEPAKTGAEVPGQGVVSS